MVNVAASHSSATTTIPTTTPSQAFPLVPLNAASRGLTPPTVSAPTTSTPTTSRPTASAPAASPHTTPTPSKTKAKWQAIKSLFPTQTSLGILGLVFAVLGVVWAIKSYNTGEWSFKMAQWTEIKDFRDDCRSVQDSTGLMSEACQAALSKELQPPPFVSASNFSQVLKRSFEATKSKGLSRTAAEMRRHVQICAVRLLHTCAWFLAWIITQIYKIRLPHSSVLWVVAKWAEGYVLGEKTPLLQLMGFLCLVVSFAITLGMKLLKKTDELPPSWEMLPPCRCSFQDLFGEVGSRAKLERQKQP